VREKKTKGDFMERNNVDNRKREGNEGPNREK